MRDFQLALVTGASSGLGKALCRSLAKENIPLILVARNQQQLERLAKELSTFVSVECLVCDLSLKQDRAKLIEMIHSRHPDLVINNAGFGLYGNALNHSTEAQMEILEVNGNAVLELSLEAAHTLFNKKRKGTILNISSAAAFFIYPNFSVYSASKAFVKHFSQSLDIEFEPFGIRVLTACPGQIETNFRTRASKNFPQKKNSYTMSCEKAAQYIMHQIKTGTTLSIFDGFYRMAIFLARLCPRKTLQKFLMKSISSRY